MKKPETEFEVDVRDLMSALGNVTIRRMFGGTGYWFENTFFALAIADTLYFKVSATTKPRYEDAGSEPFIYSTYRGPTTLKTYYQVPPAVMDDCELFAEWAREAVDAAREAKR